MNYVTNYMKTVIRPMMQGVAQQFQTQAQHADLAAGVINDLMDFLEQEGFRIGKDGRVRLNSQEFSAFRKKKALGTRQQQRANADA
jgi:hypothetical protein